MNAINDNGVPEPGEKTAAVPAKSIDFPALYNTVLNLLEENLPAHLTYHNPAHTVGVVEATEKLAEAEGLSEEETLLVKTAALFHDSGFLRTYKNHEEASCEMAKENLPAYGYSTAQVETICRIIMATRLPNRPVGKLQQILCDADLHYVGTDHYFTTAEKLFYEFKKEGLVKTRGEWQEKQILFLKAHRFFTPSGQKWYEEKKNEHLKSLSLKEFKWHHQHDAIKDIFLIVLGVLIAGLGLESFLVPNGFVDGGVTGISLLVHELNHDNFLAYYIVAFNLPFIIAGYYSVNKKFAFKTLAAVILLGLCLKFLPYPIVTSDKLLISIFGGVFLGLGIGLTMRAGCALDGIEVLALYTLKRTSFTITEIIMGMNIIIFAIDALEFGLEPALYSVLTYLAASRMIDYVIEGIQAYTGVTIISRESETIKHVLVNELGRGITVYKGERGFLPGNFDVSNECDIIFTLVTRMELRKLKNLVYETDPKAFVFAHTIREASGGIIKRKESH
ncbi:YitT family protein [Flavisolibacter nicotianae]|uniref:YitT family protein n=1 Tax=Flavisolibacter nicotianae TaxID=2364882 RepID=UPI0019696634|nr:YitT family protein [Flavisolibacter nicotianae]